jgi:hypothetical protein
MSRTTLDLIDAAPYEAKQVEGWLAVETNYALGWRCVAAFTSDRSYGAVFYVLERPLAGESGP